MDQLNTSCPALSYVIDLSSMEVSPLHKSKFYTNGKSNSCTCAFLDNDSSDSVSGQGDMPMSRKTLELFHRNNKHKLTIDDLEKKLKEADDRRRSIINDKKRKSEIEMNKIYTGIETRSKQINESKNKIKIELEEDIAMKYERRQQFLNTEQQKAKREIEKVEEAKRALLEKRLDDQITKINRDMEKKENLRSRRITSIVDSCKSHFDHVQKIRDKRKSNLNY